MTDWTHDALAADLMDRRHTFGEIAMEKLALSYGIVDVASMRLSWTRPRLTAYEVKISRADFLGDVRAGKYRKYLQCVERLYFATPKGLVDVREMPPGCGLIWRAEKGWYTARAAPVHPVGMGMRARFVQALLFRHYGAAWDGATRCRANIRAALEESRCETWPGPL